MSSTTCPLLSVDERQSLRPAAGRCLRVALLQAGVCVLHCCSVALLHCSQRVGSMDGSSLSDLLLWLCPSLAVRSLPQHYQQPRVAGRLRGAGCHLRRGPLLKQVGQLHHGRLSHPGPDDPGPRDPDRAEGQAGGSVSARSPRHIHSTCSCPVLILPAEPSRTTTATYTRLPLLVPGLALHRRSTKPEQSVWRSCATTRYDR